MLDVSSLSLKNRNIMNLNKVLTAAAIPPDPSLAAALIYSISGLIEVSKGGRTSAPPAAAAGAAVTEAAAAAEAFKRC